MHKHLKAVIVAFFFISITMISKAQSTDALGGFTPYSLYGIGELISNGSGFNRGMGGIGIGVRDNTIINYSNIASITERDTLSFMMDFGIVQKNNYLKDYSRSSAYNVFNLHNIVLSVPIYDKNAIILGITPYSATGYKYNSKETDYNIINEIGNVNYYQYGMGYINKAFFGGAVKLWKRISLGVEGIYYFGNITNKNSIVFSDTYNKTINYSIEKVIGSWGGKAGIQYSQPLGKSYNLTIGGVYGFASSLKGDETEYVYTTSSVTDTIKHEVSDLSISIPQEIGAGISLRKTDKWMIGFDYLRQDWSKTDFDNKISSVDFGSTLKESFKVGFELIPNKYDVRYYLRRATYRGGAYFNKSYVMVDNQQINSMGITFGMTLPIRLNYKYNGVTFAIDVGQKGSKNSNLIRERYVNLMINVNLHDFWFRKFYYD